MEWLVALDSTIVGAQQHTAADGARRTRARTLCGGRGRPLSFTAAAGTVPAQTRKQGAHSRARRPTRGPTPPRASLRLRQDRLRSPQRRRTLRPPTQAMARHRHPPRQTARPLPRRHHSGSDHSVSSAEVTLNRRRGAPCGRWSRGRAGVRREAGCQRALQLARNDCFRATHSAMLHETDVGPVHEGDLGAAQRASAGRGGDFVTHVRRRSAPTAAEGGQPDLPEPGRARALLGGDTFRGGRGASTAHAVRRRGLCGGVRR